VPLLLSHRSFFLNEGAQLKEKQNANPSHNHNQFSSLSRLL
jgi:hypothetical protein